VTRTILAVLQSVGLDPYRGFFHVIRHGCPALALDMMEPYRPIIADSVVLIRYLSALFNVAERIRPIMPVSACLATQQT
jgi:CRISPR/Cas system-associated endonuclease Cas1